jgi:hypothetical protein
MNYPISKYLYAAFIFSFFIFGSVTLISQMNTGSGNQAEIQKFNSTTNKLEELNTQTNIMTSNIDSGIGETGTLGMINQLITTAWNTLKNIPTTFVIITETITSMSGLYGIPSWVLGILTSVIGIMILFGIYAAVFQRDI